jgi:hypothetical protein
VRPAPIVAICWRQARTIRRQAQDIRRLERAYRVAVDANQHQAVRLEGWRVRALSLFLVADPDLRDLIMRHHATLDRLPTGGSDA